MSAADACFICFEKLVDHVKGPCGHIMCRECAGSWLLRKAECPVCRQALTMADIDIASAPALQTNAAAEEAKGLAVVSLHIPRLSLSRPILSPRPMPSISPSLNHIPEHAAQQTMQRERSAPLMGLRSRSPSGAFPRSSHFNNMTRPNSVVQQPRAMSFQLLPSPTLSSSLKRHSFSEGTTPSLWKFPSSPLPDEPPAVSRPHSDPDAPKAAPNIITTPRPSVPSLIAWSPKLSAESPRMPLSARTASMQKRTSAAFSPPPFPTSHPNKTAAASRLPKAKKGSPKVSMTPWPVAPNRMG